MRKQERARARAVDKTLCAKIKLIRRQRRQRMKWPAAQQVNHASQVSMLVVCVYRSYCPEQYKVEFNACYACLVCYILLEYSSHRVRHTHTNSNLIYLFGRNYRRPIWTCARATNALDCCARSLLFGTCA